MGNHQRRWHGLGLIWIKDLVDDISIHCNINLYIYNISYNDLFFMNISFIFIANIIYIIKLSVPLAISYRAAVNSALYFTKYVYTIIARWRQIGHIKNISHIYEFIRFHQMVTEIPWKVLYCFTDFIDYSKLNGKCKKDNQDYSNESLRTRLQLC